MAVDPSAFLAYHQSANFCLYAVDMLAANVGSYAFDMLTGHFYSYVVDMMLATNCILL